MMEPSITSVQVKTAVTHTVTRAWLPKWIRVNSCVKRLIRQ